MKLYDALFFWLGGVLVPALPELTISLLASSLKGHDFVHHRQQLRLLADALALGKISPREYCESALAVCKVDTSAPALEDRLLTAALLRQPLAKMIGEIPSRYERWLVVDYPKAWYDQFTEHNEIDALFPHNRVIFVEQLELLSMTPDIFYRLPQKAARPMQDCIIIDSDASRAVQSFKHGLASIFYVYLERLKLELALQEIWQTDADVMHPTSSERVTL